MMPAQTIIEWAATSLSVVGAIINIRKSRWGFAVWMLASVIWIWWGLTMNPISWGLCLSQAMFLVINIFGFRAWSRRSET